jgi:hypothetical protein
MIGVIRAAVRSVAVVGHSCWKLVADPGSGPVWLLSPPDSPNHLSAAVRRNWCAWTGAMSDSALEHLTEAGVGQAAFLAEPHGVSDRCHRVPPPGPQVAQ